MRRIAVGRTCVSWHWPATTTAPWLITAASRRARSPHWKECAHREETPARHRPAARRSALGVRRDRSVRRRGGRERRAALRPQDPARARRSRSRPRRVRRGAAPPLRPALGRPRHRRHLGAPRARRCSTTIRDLGLELQVIFNKGAVMVLPSGVNKAIGLAAALRDLGLSPHNVVGVGDAENDHAFLSRLRVRGGGRQRPARRSRSGRLVTTREPRRRRRRADRPRCSRTISRDVSRGSRVTSRCSAATDGARGRAFRPTARTCWWPAPRAAASRRSRPASGAAGRARVPVLRHRPRRRLRDARAAVALGDASARRRRRRGAAAARASRPTTWS